MSLAKLEQFFHGIEQGNINIVRQCIADGVDINARNQQGKTALDLSIDHGLDAIMEILLDAGVNTSLTATVHSETSCEPVNTDNDNSLIDVCKTVKVLWSDVLGYAADQLETHQSFLDLGGDSLSVTRLVARIQQKFSVDFSYQNVVDNPTIDTMVKFIEQHRSNGSAILPELIEL